MGKPITDLLIPIVPESKAAYHTLTIAYYQADVELVKTYLKVFAKHCRELHYDPPWSLGDLQTSPDPVGTPIHIDSNQPDGKGCLQCAQDSACSGPDHNYNSYHTPTSITSSL